MDAFVQSFFSSAIQELPRAGMQARCIREGAGCRRRTALEGMEQKACWGLTENWLNATIKFPVSLSV